MDITEYRVCSSKIKNKLKAVCVSDIHECPTENVLEALENTGPDFTVIPGDFVHRENSWERGAAFLKAAAGVAQVFCSLGNHDIGIRELALQAIKDSGAVLLDNKYVEYRGIRIGGLSSPSVKKEMSMFQHTPAPDSILWLDEFSEGDMFKLLLCHHPEHFNEFVKPENIDLALCGHAHGGQWRIFGHGIFAPGQGIFPKYTGGAYYNRMIVSRGLGNPHRIPRINNAPEFIIIVFEPGKAQTTSIDRIR